MALRQKAPCMIGPSDIHIWDMDRPGSSVIRSRKATRLVLMKPCDKFRNRSFSNLLPGARNRALGLLELVGVLAIVTILATLVYRLLPGLQNQARQGQAVQIANEASVTEALVNVEAVKAATLEHCARFRSIASSNGTLLSVTGTYDRYDRVLLAEGLLEKPFGARIGSDALVRMINVSGLSASTPVGADHGAYDLSGTGRNEVMGASYVVEAVFTDVTEADAKGLNDRLDGQALGADSLGGSDLRGRVVYALPRPGGLREVHVYITGQ